MYVKRSEKYEIKYVYTLKLLPFRKHYIKIYKPMHVFKCNLYHLCVFNDSRTWLSCTRTIILAECELNDCIKKKKWLVSQSGQIKCHKVIFINSIHRNQSVWIVFAELGHQILYFPNFSCSYETAVVSWLKLFHVRKTEDLIESRIPGRQTNATSRQTDLIIYMWKIFL